MNMKQLQHRYEIKPLSANRMFARKGRTTFKTTDYQQYQETMRDQLMEDERVWPFGTSQVIFLVTAGVSNRGSDLDNLIKPLLDTYQGIFPEFNDNKVYGIYLIKDIVSKGSEYIEVTVRKMDNEN